jgi:hypothetical protein
MIYLILLLAYEAPTDNYFQLIDYYYRFKKSVK